jgi:RNA polymerase sigma-70 factor (ECF subfamily)
VARIAAGDWTAEEDLVTRYSDMVACELRTLLFRNRDVAEDIHQETFKIVLQRLRGQGLAEAQKLGAYLRRIARNLALAEIRRAARQNLSGDEHALAGVVDPAADPLTSMLRQEQTRRLRRALDRLSRGRDRELLSRFYLAEEDRESIRRDLGVTTLHFNRLLFRARRRLGRILESFQRGNAGERKVRR